MPTQSLSPTNGHSMAPAYTTLQQQQIDPQIAPDVFRQKIRQLEQYESENKQLLMQMLQHCDSAAEMSYDLEREREHNRLSQKRIRELERQLAEKDEITARNQDKLSQELRSLRDRDPFVLALLDGDGLVFADELIAAGEDGGRKAAALFEYRVKEFLQDSDDPELSSIAHAKIVCRLYVSMKSFSEVCYRAGLASRSDVVEQFFRGFTKSKLLFDSIDVGQGKDRADEKIRENFKLNLFDPHCRQIILGCSHDNGYRRLLEDYESDEDIRGRVTLLEGVPFEFELKMLPFKKVKFGDIFRNTKIVVPAAAPAVHAASLPIRTQTPPMVIADGATKPKATTWATAAAAPGPPSNGVPVAMPRASQSGGPAADGGNPPRHPSPPPIRRNKYGNRIDPAFNITDKLTYDRVKALRLCNQWYLNGQCYKDDCRNQHDYKATPRELAMLRLVARTMPCFQGSDCDDMYCLAGHHCQNETSPLGRCQYGSKCKFADLHGIDRNAVATVKIGS